MGNVCSETVAHDLCIGCGVCAAMCPMGNLTMEWSDDGFLQPSCADSCEATCRLCLDVCPFQESLHNEDTLAGERFASLDGMRFSAEAGYYLAAYVGHAGGEYRERGASGGLATWILVQLLERDMVDSVICVRPTGDPNRLYSFQLCSTAPEIEAGAGSAYYPTTLAQTLRIVLERPGRYAITGLPCFLKGVRLAMHNDPRLAQRIRYLVGLACGHLKSRLFAEALGRAASCPNQPTAVKFRETAPDSPPSDFTVGVSWEGGESRFRMSEVFPTAWPAGLFKPRACDFCDDVFAEMADVVCMDAWLPPYNRDGNGTSIIVVRSAEIHRLIAEGRAARRLMLDPIDIERVVESQQGHVVRKRQMLAYRLALCEPERRPKKRVDPRTPGRRIRRILTAQEKVRRTSLIAMARQREAAPTGLDSYHALMEPVLQELSKAQTGTPVSRMLAGTGRLLRRILGLRSHP